MFSELLHATFIPQCSKKYVSLKNIMFNYEHSSDFKIRSAPRFEKPNYPFPRNPVHFLRRPFPLLRRRMMSNRYSNMGFRPLGNPALRSDDPTPHGKAPDFRYPISSNSAIGLAPPAVERLPFPSTTSSNSFENRNLQYPPLRSAVVNYSNNQTVIDSSERTPLINELNSYTDLWVEALANNGRKYYYNARTRITTWERPIHVRIIDLNEMKRLQNCSGLEYSQNSPKDNQNPFVQQQPCISYGNSFFPRNFSVPPRLMVLPRPQNVCNPPPIFPVPSTKHVPDTTFYKFSSVIPPPLLSFPMVNGNLLRNNASIDYNMNVASAEGNTLQPISHTYAANDEFSGNESKVSDWSSKNSEVPVYKHSNVEQENASKNDDSNAVQEIFHESDNFISENNSENSKPQESPICETKFPGDASHDEKEWPFSKQPIQSKEQQADKSQPSSITHIAGTNWHVVSTRDERVFYFDSERKISVWEKPIELMDRSKTDDVPKEDKKQHAAQEESLPDSDNCKSENDIQSSKAEASTSEIECLSPEKPVESKKEQQLDKSRPVSSTPVCGTRWFVVWTGDERVFYFDSQHKISVWERPRELLNRCDVDKLTQKSPLSQDLKSLKKEVRKLESNGSDPIKKLKKEDEKKDTDSSGNIESNDSQKEEKLKLDEIPHEEKIKIFREMLAEKNVSASSTWEKDLHKIVFDSRYLLLSSKERKRAFDSYISDKVEEDKSSRQKELHNQKEKFISLLKEAGVTSKSRFHDLAQRYGKDARFRAIEKIKQREKMFNQYVLELVKNEREHEKTISEQKKRFLELLGEQKLIDTEISWLKVQANIAEDERYKAIPSNSAKEKIFKECIKGLSVNYISKEREDRICASIRNREEQVKRDLSVHLRDRERERELHKQTTAISAFKALLNDLIQKSDISWHSAKKIMKEDHRWNLALCLESENREELFNKHIDSLNCKKREQFHRLLDEIPDITLKTSWLDVRKTVLNDSRCSKFSSSERKCEKEFKEYLWQKSLLAKSEFKELLKETKMITYKSKSLLNDFNHLKDIEETLALDKRYFQLECMRSERKDILLSYINKLHEQGPPPPPTATISSNR